MSHPSQTQRLDDVASGLNNRPVARIAEDPAAPQDRCVPGCVRVGRRPILPMSAYFKGMRPDPRSTQTCATRSADPELAKPRPPAADRAHRGSPPRGRPRCRNPGMRAARHVLSRSASRGGRSARQLPQQPPPSTRSHPRANQNWSRRGTRPPVSMPSGQRFAGTESRRRASRKATPIGGSRPGRCASPGGSVRRSLPTR